MTAPNESPGVESECRPTDRVLRRRIRPLASANEAMRAPRGSGRRMALPEGSTLPWLLTALLFLGVIGLVAWGVGLRSDLDTTRATLTVRGQDLATVRLGANATAYTLVPTAEGPELARGVAFFQPEGSGVLHLSNLPALDPARAYQLWYFPVGDEAPIPGDTFNLNEDGIAFSLIPADVGAVRALGISAEPTAGSQAPTGPIILIGTLGGARG